MTYTAGNGLALPTREHLPILARIPDIVGIAPSMSVSFRAYRLGEARVVWLNSTWLVEHGGMDPDDPDARAAVERWVLEEYAFATPSDALSAGVLGTEETTFWADRYGAPVGCNSGGSGRCGMKGQFHVKGCGATPLVGKDVHWIYSHGCVWLEEAIREAIYSEIAFHSFPHSAVPVVAIVDVGANFIHYAPDGSPIVGARRALLLRPNFLRPASLQRSIMFGSSGTPDSDQYLDADRVKHATRAFLLADDASPERSKSRVGEVFLKLAEQVGFGWAHRLSHDYMASNLTLDGQLVDFGSFRAVPTWRMTKYFGNELHQLFHSFEAICFYARKYTGVGFDQAEKANIKSAMTLAAKRQFFAAAQQVVEHSGSSSNRAPSELPDLAWTCFQELQQQGAFMERDGRVTGTTNWIEACRKLSPSRASMAASGSLAKLYAQSTPDSALRRWLGTRSVWYRETVLKLSQAYCSPESLELSDYAERLSRFISTMSSRYPAVSLPLGCR